jgi:rhodanese-related sulfurtransferase
MLGYIAENLLSGLTKNVQWYEVDDLVSVGAVILDVRNLEEFAAGAIPGSINVPLDDLRTRMSEIPDGPVVVYCKVGQRGHTATVLLRENGFEAVNLDGGFTTWNAVASSKGLVAATKG